LELGALHVSEIDLKDTEERNCEKNAEGSKYSTLSSHNTAVSTHEHKHVHVLMKKKKRRGKLRVATKETEQVGYLVKTTETLGGLFVFVLFIAILQFCRGGGFCLFVSSSFSFSCYTLSRV
jgi:hypothetical protein